ncbi:MAG: hypothetical protein IKR92_05240 [Alphaproteobacteria bacterium]|nr:hypothetical protein [Alphaproteobacteria bacterium]
MEKLKSATCAQIGNFVLRNHQCSAVKTEECIKGILVSPEYYLDIDSLLKTPISKKEALLYGRSLNMLLPTKKQMHLIEEHLETINNRLLSIGRGDCMLLGAIVNQFWTRFENRPDERRKVLFLAPI